MIRMIWENRRLRHLVAIFLVTAAAVAVARGRAVQQGEKAEAEWAQTGLKVLLPFVFTPAIDPRSVVTVGDQVVSEHVFAFHLRESLRKGMAGVASEVFFDRARSRILLKRARELFRANGQAFSQQDTCSALKASLRGTSHAPIAPLVQEVHCEPETITVQFSQLPVNIQYLFTLSDFSLFDPGLLPLRSGADSRAATGPYSLLTLSESEVKLKRNPFYPRELTANAVDSVTLQSYPASKTPSVIAEALKQRTPLAYLYGYAANEELLAKVRAAGYSLRQMPSEWLVYFGINSKVPLEDRKTFSRVADGWREELLTRAALGQPAFSMSPSDRPFGLKREDYQQITAPLSSAGVNAKFSRPGYILATLDEWSEIPLFAAALQRARESFPDLKIQLLPRSRITELWSDKVDFVLSPMGIAPSDPLNSLAFLEELGPVISRDEIARISTLQSAESFNLALRDIEKRVLEARLWVPIGHFPGLVIEAPGVERDEELSWSWGIQAWTYRLRSRQ